MKVDSITYQSYERLSSMQRINQSSDDPAGLAISEKLDMQIKGTEQGTENALDMSNLLNTAEGSLDSIHENLQRMRELAVQASNGILSNDDKAILQQEINQLKSSIGDSVKNTEFNSIKLLDGTFTNKNAAINSSGTGMKMHIKNTGLEALGIENFDVTKDFNIEDLDNAIEKVSSSRSDLGASNNRLSHAVNYNRISSYNQTEANSRIVDLDIGKEIINLQRNKILDQYKFFSQKQSSMQLQQNMSILL
ncbi:flagellin [Tepidibacter sp. Z1-5]|uniref:flagellin n=1 Tax=Tepidibacter sp. Z1-5 TaxID=3134138 RepID=UPI0030C55B66